MKSRAKNIGVTNADIAALRWAIGRAKEWKGNLMPADYPSFDAQVERCEQALKRVRADRQRIKEFYS